ncbi:MAG: hypothetical protein QXR53_04520 [Candidatus Norongarragalinales archaeon]
MQPQGGNSAGIPPEAIMPLLGRLMEMHVFPSGFQSTESLVLLALLAVGTLSGSVALVFIALAFAILLYRKRAPRPEDEFTY